ncbi:MAG TPA: acyltransferase, partial [Acidimicrobiales bacterium]|nr:acyltransferase [Acidimicrobiales bacterium]
MIAFPRGALYNEKWIRIGSHTLVGPYTSLSAGMAPGQKMVTDPVVSIGDRTLIGRGSHIVGHFCIEIGDDIQT